MGYAEAGINILRQPNRDEYGANAAVNIPPAAFIARGVVMGQAGRAWSSPANPCGFSGAECALPELRCPAGAKGRVRARPLKPCGVDGNPRRGRAIEAPGLPHHGAPVQERKRRPATTPRLKKEVSAQQRLLDFISVATPWRETKNAPAEKPGRFVTKRVLRQLSQLLAFARDLC